MIRKRQVKHVRQYLSSSKIRKKRQRRRILRLGLFICIAALLCAGFIYVNRLTAFQMKSTVISGNILVPTEKVEQTVQQYLGARKVLFGLIPNTNSFFIPEHGIKQVILEQIPRIEDVGVDISMRGVLTVSVAEKTMRAVWCTDHMKVQCYDIDIEGNLFERTQETVDASYVYTGIMYDAASSTLAGKNFIAPHLLEKSERFMQYLTETGFVPQYIECNTELTCIAYVNVSQGEGSVSGARSRIVFDVQSDLGLVAERLTVALGGEALKGKKFAYIDTRFGNKLFYKYSDSEGAQEDDLASDREDSDTQTASTSKAVPASTEE